MTDIETRIDRIESREEIRTLVARYGQYVDERRLDEMVQLFTADGRFHHHDGTIDVTGHDELIGYYQQVEKKVGAAFHYVHSHIIDFEDADHARGTLSAHAELWVNETLLMTGLRYEDAYRREGGAWKIADREVWFWYAMPWNDMATSYGDQLRRRWPGDPRPAELPHGLETWKAFWAHAEAEA